MSGPEKTPTCVGVFSLAIPSHGNSHAILTALHVGAGFPCPETRALKPSFAETSEDRSRPYKTKLRTMNAHSASNIGSVILSVSDEGICLKKILRLQLRTKNTSRRQRTAWVFFVFDFPGVWEWCQGISGAVRTRGWEFRNFVPNVGGT